MRYTLAFYLIRRVGLKNCRAKEEMSDKICKSKSSYPYRRRFACQITNQLDKLEMNTFCVLKGTIQKL